MKFNRAKNASRNILFGTILKTYQMFLPFAMRTIMVYTIGVEYLGLNSLFTSILQTLNLAELGVGSAMVFSMYKPIAEDDNTTVCALMKLYRTYYRVIGAVVLTAGLFLLPFLPRLIASGVPANINIYVLYLLNLFATVLTYWLFAYKNSILTAHQRQDVISKIILITETIKYALQIAVLIILKNYYFYVIAILATQIMTNVFTAIMSDKLYPEFKPAGKLPIEEVKKINGRIRDIFTAKLGGKILGPADTIVISAFLGLKSLAIYQNYYYILNAVMGFVTIIYSSITAGVGNSLITKSKEDNYKDFCVFTFMVMWLMGFCVSCFAVLYQPFMVIWMGKDMMLDYPIVIMLCAMFVVWEVLHFLNVYKDAGGIWHQDRFRPLISGIANIVLNIIMVQFIGLYGVVLSTVVSMAVISLPWIIHNVFANVFKMKSAGYIKKLVYYVAAISAVAAVTYFAASFIQVDGIAALAVKSIICVFLSNILLFAAMCRLPEFKKAKELMLRLLPLKRRKGN